MRAFSSTVLLTVLVSQTAWAGWVLDQKTTTRNPQGSSTSLTKTTLEGDKFRIEMSQDGANTSPAKIITVFDGKQLFTCTTLADAPKKGQCFQQQLDLLGLNSQAGQGITMKEFKITPTGKKQKIAGLTCNEHRFDAVTETAMGQVKTTEVQCTAPEIDYSKVVDAMAASIGKGGLAKGAQEMKRYRAIGYPVARSMNYQGFSSSTTTLSAKKVKTEASLFRIPQGFALVENPFAQLKPNSGRIPSGSVPPGLKQKLKNRIK